MFFFVLSFLFRVGRLEVGGQVLFLQAVFGCGEQCPLKHWTFHASFIGGGRGGAGGEDLFSF